VPPLRNIVNIRARNSNHFKDPGHLIIFTFSWEDRVANVELCHDASKAPHVYPASIRNAQHDLWSSIEPGLNVSVDSFFNESGTSKVYDLNA